MRALGSESPKGRTAVGNHAVRRLLVGALLLSTASCAPRQAERAVAPPAPVSTSLLTASSSTTQPTGRIRILFVGNSHTANHDVPDLVAELLESAGGREVVTSMRTTTFLRTALDNSAIVSAVSSGDWDLVVLQGQEISQSHTIDYSTAEAVALAHMAESAGAQALFFAEWSRRGVDETEYIENIYANIAERSDAAVIPVGRSWDRLLADRSNYELWAVDGNHAASDGALLAAATIAFFIAGPDAPITTTGDDHRLLLEAARLTIEDLD